MIDQNQQLPKGWQWVRLANLIDEFQSGFACGERDQHGVIQLRMNNVDTLGNFVWDEFIRVPADTQTIAQYKLEPGDILFNNTNSVELVGKSALFEGYIEPVVYSNHFTRLRTNEIRLFPAFFSAWLNYQWSQGVFSIICNRWIGQSAVKASKLLVMDFPLPPLPEQKRIAAILKEQMATVERARKAAEDRLEAAKSLRLMCVRSLMTGDQAKNWPKHRFGDMCEIIMGQSPKGISCNKMGIGIPLLNGPTEFGEEYPTPVQWTTAPTRFAERGDILFCVRGATTGRMNVADRRYCVGRGLAAIRGRKGLTSTPFVQYLLEVITYSLRDKGSGSTFLNLPGSELAAFKAFFPSIDLQLNIVRRLDAQKETSKQLEVATKAELDAIGALPSVLLRQAFAGELEN